MSKKGKLVMLRHGESMWNRKNFFTGWVDVPLSEQGIAESLQAGKRIAKIPFDVVFVSSLIRAQMTAMLALSVHEEGRVPYIVHFSETQHGQWAQIYSQEAQKEGLPVIVAWELNERMYGELQGMNKQEMRQKYGEQQVHIWRRSFDAAPPQGESLAMTAARSIPYFEKNIVPHLAKGQNVFIAAHGNSLRSIIMYIDKLSKEQVVSLELATGEPIIYEYRDGTWIK